LFDKCNKKESAESRILAPKVTCFFMSNCNAGVPPARQGCEPRTRAPTLQC